jgi:hypothetical protein
MLDVETIPVAGTAAEQAVSHILRRVVNDRNFSWYLIGTESLRKCLVAEAARLGSTDEAVEVQMIAAMKAVDQRGKREPDVEVLRKRIDAIDQHLGHMSDRGKINDADYTALCDFVHVDPADWKEPAYA